MEVSIFPDPMVRAHKTSFIEARLHSDAENPVHRERIAGLIETVAKSTAQPIYVAVDPATEAEISRYSGAALTPDEFAEFLSDAAGELGLEGPGAQPVARPDH
ncbi:MAG: hypothetical protein AAGA20_14015 [Planctomycetota bacterium]